MRKVLLVRFGEVYLKGLNRSSFLKILTDNVKKAVKGTGASVWLADSRIYVAEFEDMDDIVNRVKKVFGLYSVSPAYEVDKDLNIRSTYERERIYSPNIQLKDYLCIGNRGDYWFIHEMGMPVAHLQTDFKKGQVIGNKLLLLNYENQFLFIDLDEAIE